MLEVGECPLTAWLERSIVTVEAWVKVMDGCKDSICVLACPPVVDVDCDGRLAMV